MRNLMLLVLFLLTAVCLISVQDSFEFHGNSIFYRLSEGPGIPLVIVNTGPGLDSSYLNEILPGSRVLIYDQLGSGASSISATISINLQYYISELASLVQELRLERFHLMGHGFGSIVATSYALTNPAGLVSLTLVNPILNIPALDALLLEESAKAKESSTDKPNLLFQVHREEIQELISHKIEYMNIDVFELFWGNEPSGVAGSLRGLDVSSGLPDIKQPTLICAGLWNFPDLDYISRYHEQSSRSELVIFMGSSHFPMLEEKEAFEMIIKDFLIRTENDHDFSVPSVMSIIDRERFAGIALFTEKDNGESVVLEPDEDFRIVLSSSPGTGYYWGIESYDDSIVRLLSEPFYEEPEGIGGGFEVFQFRVIGSGNTAITLSYCSCWNDSPIRKYELNIESQSFQRETLSITEADLGKSFDIDLRVPVEIRLGVTTGTGMSWRITGLTPGILRQTKEYDFLIPPDTPDVGGEIEQVYFFEGINYGSAKLQFAYGRPWEEAPPDKTYSATITVREPVQNVLMLQESDNNRSINLKGDSILIIKLKESISSDYSWYLPADLPTKLKLISDPSHVKIDDMRYSAFYFKAVEPGEEAIQIFYGSVESMSNGTQDSFRVEVVVTK